MRKRLKWDVFERVDQFYPENAAKRHPTLTNNPSLNFYNACDQLSNSKSCPGVIDFNEVSFKQISYMHNLILIDFFNA